MSRFDRMYQELVKYFEQKEFVKAAEIGQRISKTMAIPPERKYIYHEAMAMCWLMAGKWQEGWRHVHKCLKLGKVPAHWENLQKSFSDWLVYIHFLPDLSDEEIFAKHREYGAVFSDIEQYNHDKARHGGHKKIKIGYISPDFYEHIVTNFAVQLYSAYDRDKYEVHLYNVGDTHNEVTGWLAEMADGWHDLQGKRAAEIAARIYADEIDILVDLAGHTKKGITLQALAYKPAPIQMSGIGYFDTTGLPAVDYYITDNYCDKPGNEVFFTEKLLRLPRSHFCYTPSETVLQCRKQWQLHKPVIFGSFSNFLKLNDEILLTWRKIMMQVPNARLLLKNVRPHEQELAELADRMQALGFEMERVELRPGTKYYLDDYADMDIALDTFPYPGGGTTCEALYMGVPVVSRYGRRHGSRFGYSILKNMGLEELTAATEDEYIRIAVALANEADLLRSLHGNLRKIMQASPLMDAKGYLQDMEAAYGDIYQQWLDLGRK